MWYNNTMGWWNKLIQNKVNTMNTTEELLVIFMEECSEAAIEASKIIRFGKGTERLESEIGDLVCMIKLLEEQGMIDMKNVEYCADAKREKLKKWSNLNV